MRRIATRGARSSGKRQLRVCGRIGSPKPGQVPTMLNSPGHGSNIAVPDPEPLRRHIVLIRMKLKPALKVLSLLLVGCGAVRAQAPPAPLTPPPPTASSASNCAPTRAASPQGTIAPEGTTTGQRTGPLSDQLAKSDGVLCPPAGVDPDMSAPTPHAGNMPVIPPPGSPGGDPTVRPK